MFKRYLKDSSGQFAIMASLVVTMLVVGTGTAIDVNGLHRSKSDIQRLADAAVLAAANSREENVGKLKQIAQAAIDANNTNNIAVKMELTLDDEDIIRIVASSTYETQLMGVVGFDKLPYSSISESPLPKKIPINVALVLDRTGSMAGDNMTSLKSASAKLIDVFDSLEGDLRVAVVPFADYVNIGMGNRHANWMDVPDDSSSVATEQSCYDKRDLIKPDLCGPEEREGNNDGVTYTYTATVCPDEAYTPYYEYCHYPTSSYTWNGCAGSRDGDGYMKPAYKGKRVPGVMNVSCGEEVLPLTINMTQVKDKINSLSASGSTYIPAGLIWGWRMLDSEQPFNDLSNSQSDRRRTVVLMTDGQNTKSLTQPTHNGTDTAAANDLTSILCLDMQSEGIEIFTVAYRLSSTSETTASLRECASSPTHFFNPDNTSDLEEAFENIGNALYQVRLSR